MNRNMGVILLVAIVVLGGIAFYLNANPDLVAKPTATTSASASRPLWTIDSSQVNGLTVTAAATGLTFRAELGGDGRWLIAEPQAAEADAGRMSTLVSTVASLYVTREITDALGLAEFGLESPAYSIQVRTLGGETFGLAVGQKAVNGYSYYVLPKGAATPVLVSTASLDSLLSLPADPPIAVPTATATAGTLEPLPTLPLPATATP